jgi:hypothetical protein
MASSWPFLGLSQEMGLLNFHNHVFPGWTYLVRVWIGRPVNHRRVHSSIDYYTCKFYQNLKLL